MDLGLNDEDLCSEFLLKLFGYELCLFCCLSHKSFLHLYSVGLQNGLSLVFVDIHDKVCDKGLNFSLCNEVCNLLIFIIIFGKNLSR